MTILATKLLMIGSMTILTACAGSGGGDENEPLGLSFGSTDPAASRSGLDYADGTQSLTDLEEQSHTVRVVRTIKNLTKGEAQRRISDEVLTITQGGNGDDFTITLDGEVLTFVDSVTLRASDQSSIDGFTPTGFSGLRNASIFQLAAVEGNSGRENELMSGFLVTCFETSPDAVMHIAGSTIYTGAVRGRTDPDNFGGNFEGDFTLAANFDDNMVDGEIGLRSFDTELGIGDLNFDIAPAQITGNGFAGDLTLTGCTFATCTANGEIVGVFYGQNADEVAGLLSLDVAITNRAGENTQTNAVAAFGGFDPDA